MKMMLDKSETRGHFNYGWLDTRHTFSFARYHNPERMSFGALRALNDDVLLPGQGFGRHPHDNMEIVSIPLRGGLLHTDSMGHQQIIGENEVQAMTAGTGLFHSEMNASSNEPVNFLQIWILPGVKNLKPDYEQKFFDPLGAEGKWQFLVDPTNEKALWINQSARISRINLIEGEETSYEMIDDKHGSYLFVVEGEAEIRETILLSRDGIEISETDSFKVKAIEDSTLLNIEIPLNF